MPMCVCGKKEIYKERKKVVRRVKENESSPVNIDAKDMKAKKTPFQKSLR